VSRVGIEPTTRKLRAVHATRFALGCAVMAAIGCAYVRGTPGITCDKLRALKIDMSTDEVLGILRPSPGGTYPMMSPGPSPIIWNYGNKSPIDGGVRLEVRFDHDRLIEVSSWVRTWWRDVHDSGPRPTTFRLTASDYIEGASS
jgi:hypothetical protein